MSTDLINKVLRAGEGKFMKSLLKEATRIGDLEPEMERQELSWFAERTEELRAEVADGKSLDDVLPEAFAMVREVSKRVMEMRNYDVQLVGAMVLHRGRIAEMKTGEGKTLAAVPAVYLNALSGKGVHVVTVNDYLARRDADWMRPIYEALGISVGVIQAMMPEAERREQYRADVTYGTNSEFGFDYLRDNMAVRLDDCVQRGHNFCIVDEVDSILIDEARTPLIISGVPEAAADTYYRFARVVPTLKKGEDYEIDEKQRTAAPTESGVDKIEKALGIENLYLDVHANLVNHLIQSLKAETLYRKDKEYIVRDGEVLIVDEFTGRVLEGRRYSEGLHQAIEAKEGLAIREENQTLATITLQNFFRLYDKLSGMTGTASTEANEFQKIYEADVVSVPTHRDMVRIDDNDLIYKTRESKYRAVVEDVAEAHENGQPVLVGTASVEVSEMLSGMFTKRGIKHAVLNAKQHEQEAEVIADAGQRGAVTIATNMAGRGVDIKLGEGVAELGGLYVIGTERHESRRIDNQLRGRSGRQGDPGHSRFYMSADDDLIRIFAGDRIYKILDRLGPEDDMPLDSKMLTKQVEGAQKKVEEQNFNIRKRVLEYDDVLNKQRSIIYEHRRAVLEGEDLGERSRDWIAELLVHHVDQFEIDGTLPADWDLDALFQTLHGYIPLRFGPEDLELDDDQNPFTREELLDELEDEAMELYEAREKEFGEGEDGEPALREIERWILLQLVDQHWREHLYAMDYLREGIHLRALGQKDPLGEYRLEGHTMFDETMEIIKHEYVRYLFNIEARPATDEVDAPAASDVDYSYAEDPVQGVTGSLTAAAAAEPDAFVEGEPEREAEGTVSGVAVVEQRVLEDIDRTGRNDPCPCGSGKKFKNCYDRPGSGCELQ